MKKVAVIGAICSGKTTLVNSYADSNYVSIVPDSGRLYLSSHTVVDRSSLEFQMSLLAFIKHLESQANHNLVVLCDGCIISPIVHMMAHGMTKEAMVITENLKDHIATYNHFLLLDIDHIPYVRDDIRNESIDFRKNLQTSYIKLVKELKLPYTLLGGTLAERRLIVDHYIN